MSLAKWSELSVLERGELWESSRREKIRAASKEKQVRELDGCTFEPQLHQFDPSVLYSMTTATQTESGFAGQQSSRSGSRVTSGGSHRNSYLMIHTRRRENAASAGKS